MLDKVFKTLMIIGLIFLILVLIIFIFKIQCHKLLIISFIISAIFFMLSILVKAIMIL
jgi:hypothetical protein